MLAFDKPRFLKVMHNQGVPSVLELSRRTGLHRNTINNYLAGQTVYQQGYLALCDELIVNPHDLVCAELCPELPDSIARTIDVLSLRYSKFVFVLFGSRARFSAKPFSDWDIGFFSSEKISHDTHLEILALTDDLCEKETDTTDIIDAINLNEANTAFLARNTNDFRYLSGSLIQWKNFKKQLCKMNLSKNRSKD